MGLIQITDTSHGYLSLIEETNEKMDESFYGTTFSWKVLPVMMAPEEKADIKYFDHIFSIFKNYRDLPSKRSGIIEGERCEIIRNIDDFYLAALQKYRESLLTATREDLAVAKRCFSKTHSADKKFAASSILFVGTILLAIVIPPVGAPLAVAAGTTAVQFKSESDSNADSLGRKSSHHRILWMKSVETLEIERFRNICWTFTTRCEKLKTDYDAYAKAAKPRIRYDFIKELRQINTFAKGYLNSNDKIFVSGENLEDLVGKLP